MERLPKELRIVLGDLDDNQDLRGLLSKLTASGHCTTTSSVLLSQRLSLLLPSSLLSSLLSEATSPPGATAQAASAEGDLVGGHGGGRGDSAVSSLAAGSAGSGLAAPTPDSMARSSSGFCYYYWQFGDKATYCKGVCSWQGK